MSIDKLLMILVFQFFVSGAGFNRPTDHELIKSSDGCLILKKDKINLDTLCLNSFKGYKVSRNQFLEVIDDLAVRVQLKTGAIDSFSDYFYLVERWGVRDNKFNLESSYKVRLGNCSARKLKFSLTSSGIKWRYSRGLFRKRLKGIILFSDLEDSKEYFLPCDN